MSEQIGASVTHFSYNALNELTASDAPGGAAAPTYQWDAEHRLISTTSGNQTTELTYDGHGRCTSIVESTSGTQTSNRRFLWAGGRIREERAADGTVSKRFFRQGMQLQTGATPGYYYYYTRDHLGSIRELVDSTGTIRAVNSYDLFGRPTQLAGDLHTDFGFAGMFYPPELGLNLTRFRLYDPNTGRWLTRDPLAKAELRQGPNLYTYVRNNPINRVDQSGLGPPSWALLPESWTDVARALVTVWKMATTDTGLHGQDLPDAEPQTETVELPEGVGPGTPDPEIEVGEAEMSVGELEELEFEEQALELSAISAEWEALSEVAIDAALLMPELLVPIALGLALSGLLGDLSKAGCSGGEA